jgi:hypothetical protein
LDEAETCTVLACASVGWAFAGELELLLVVAGELAEADDVDWLQSATVVCTGLRTHRRMCLFRLDITPKRRPQVSHTKASNEKVSGKEKQWLGQMYPFLQCERASATSSKPSKPFLSNLLCKIHSLYAMC